MSLSPATPEPNIVRLGNTKEEIVPHHVPGVGARVFIVRDTATGRSVENVSPDTLRAYADQLKIAACQAESMERTAKAKAARGYVCTKFTPSRRRPDVA